jgi:hypothetical protein
LVDLLDDGARDMMASRFAIFPRHMHLSPSIREGVFHQLREFRLKDT